jgi:hypothetical protein
MTEPTAPETADPATGRKAHRDASHWAAKVDRLQAEAREGMRGTNVQTRAVCLDPRRQWRRAGNVWQNSMARSVLQTVTSPLTGAQGGPGRGRPAAS